MKKNFSVGLIILSSFVLSACGNTQQQNQTQAAPNTVSCSRVVGEAVVVMDENGFNPPEITVPVCTKVTFKNTGTNGHWPASNIHPTHGIYPEFDPKQGINPGDSWSFVFDRVGRWRDHDHLYPGITGVVNVTQ